MTAQKETAPGLDPPCAAIESPPKESDPRTLPPASEQGNEQARSTETQGSSGSALPPEPQRGRDLAELEYSADLERRAVLFDGGAGLAAVAACLARPVGLERDAEIALWARQLAATPHGFAAVLSDDMPFDEVQVIAALAHAMHAERRGASS